MKYCRVENIVLEADGVLENRFRNGDTRDIIRVIQEADRMADDQIHPEGAECLRGGNQMETLKNVWAFIRANVQYKADKPGFELVKTPGALFRQYKSGDCKSMSIAAAALLRALGFSGIRYRFVAFEPGDFTHVFVVVRVGGEDVILDAVFGRFGKTQAWHHFKDYAVTRSKVASLGQVSGPIETGMKILIGISALWLASKIFGK